MVRNWIKSCIIVLGISLFFIGDLYSQNRSSSPYSMYGVGIVSNARNLNSEAMGGIFQGLRVNGLVNFANPASYTALEPQSFSFNTGVLTNKGSLSSVNGSETVSHATLDYLAFGFQVAKGWKTSIGIIPYSSSEYFYGSLVEDPLHGNVVTTNTGNGGLNEFYWGHGLKIGEKLSIGINASFMFGTITREKKLIFADTTIYFGTSYLNRIKASDFKLKYGIQYHTELKNGMSFIAGATYTHKTNISAERDYIVSSFSITKVGVDFTQETIVNDSAIAGQLVLPASFGAGFMIGNPEKWMLGLDFEAQNWSDYREFGKVDSLNNSFSVSLGGEYTPDRTNVYSYLKRITYRFGVNYEKSNLSLRNQSINEYGISFGVSLPMKRSKSTINMAVEFGQRGTTSNNLIKEKYLKFRLGISLYQRWFEQRKYY